MQRPDIQNITNLNIKNLNSSEVHRTQNTKIKEVKNRIEIHRIQSSEIPDIINLKIENIKSLERNGVFATNFNFIIPISLGPNVVDLGYFKL